jgi:nucleotide-binding universal stress UspA family protein
MKTIIVINDHSAEARHAAKLALNIARKQHADLILANVTKFNERIPVKTYVLANGNLEINVAKEFETGTLELLESISNSGNDFKPNLLEIDTSDFSANALAQLIIKGNIQLIVKGANQIAETNTEKLHINIQAVLNRVQCPLLLVPDKYELKDFERMVYMTDLRYCQLPVVRYLAQLAKLYQASLLVAHLSSAGLTNMEQHYAKKVFKDVISCNVNYDHLFFNNVEERNIHNAVDVMINGMRTDLLALVNHQFHLEEILGGCIPHALPGNITIPLLIFPF